MLGARGERWVRVCLCAVSILAIGEVRRAWLRHAYRADEHEAASDLLRPISTTDLQISRFTVAVPALSVERLRVVHLTDLHVSDRLPKSYFRRVNDEIRALDPAPGRRPHRPTDRYRAPA
jgi:hypothetical protein